MESHEEEEMYLTFSEKERLLLSNQYRILELIDEDNAKDWENARAIVENGFEYEYSTLTGSIFAPLPAASSKFVHDVFDMHLALQSSWKSLKDRGGVDAESLVFRGFDGNNEAEYLSYARFLVEDLDRWGHVGQEKGLNSHAPMVATYRRMLATWRQSKDTHQLSLAEIKRILAP